MDNIHGTQSPQEQKKAFFESTFCTLFHKTALTYPDKLAVVCGDASFTYRELDNASNLIARYLLAQNPEQEEIVAVRMGRDIRTVASFLGVWKAGCAYVYLDDSYPKEGNELLLGMCDCRVILDEALLDCFDWREESSYLDYSVYGQLALLVFTSGSTGCPKGVMLEHGQVMTALSNLTVFETCAADCMAFFPGFGVVASVFDLYSSLVMGATLYIVPGELRKDIHALVAFYRRHQITLTFLPPHMAQKLLALELGGLKLRLLLVGSEPVRALRAAPFRILHIYGASELCAMASYYEITDARKVYPFGKLCDTLRGYLVDEEGHPVKPGESGELWIAGGQLSRGYFRDPVRTQAQFIPNPFESEPPFDRLFKTNDMARLDENGDMIYLGRRDNMYKIRGFRVEAGQVEVAMLSCGHVQEAVVKAFSDCGGCQILCGYFMADTAVDVKELKAQLREKLAHYMVPTCLFQVAEFPRNFNQKIRRDAIRPPAELDDHKLLELRY